MPEFLFHLPLPVAGFLIIGALCAYSLVGLILVRRFILPRLKVSEEDSEFTGAMVQAMMVFYGLAVALVAVSVWETHSEVSGVVSMEASRLGGLYRDVSGYPEPIRVRTAGGAARLHGLPDRRSLAAATQGHPPNPRHRVDEPFPSHTVCLRARQRRRKSSMPRRCGPTTTCSRSAACAWTPCSSSFPTPFGSSSRSVRASALAPPSSSRCAISVCMPCK